MTELHAEPLSPIDAATLWPQLHRLGTEVIATRGTESLLVSAGLAATGLTRLPRVPRTAVVGVKRGLGYRGVAVARELAGGAGWETVSARLARECDDEALVALMGGICREISSRGARTVLLRYPEGSPHTGGLRRSGFIPHTIERLHALPRRTAEKRQGPFRPAGRQDRAGVFRLYCRSVPEHVRRQEAPTQQDWRAVVDSFDCHAEYVLEPAAGIVAWVGVGEREARALVDSSAGPDVAVEALDLVEHTVGRNGTLVLSEHQIELEREAERRGYTPLGTRLFCARRLALSNPLKEVKAVPAIEAAPLSQ